MRIRFDDVGFSYGGQGNTLNHIDLDLSEPGLVCIIGPNGVGKSTLVKCMNKLLNPTEGHVYIDDVDVKERSFKDMSKIMGYVPANSDDFFPMTVVETVLMGRHPHNNWSYSEEDRRIVYEAMKSMSVEYLAMRNFGELSAGQHQRVMLARGLAQQPEVLILDEPTANLDVRHQLLVTETVRNLALETRKMIIMVSHDLNVASKYADLMIVMSTPGVIYKVGTPKEVITEETIAYVYGVSSKIFDIEGRPHVVLLKALSNEEVEKMHSENND